MSIVGADAILSRVCTFMAGRDLLKGSRVCATIRNHPAFARMRAAMRDSFASGHTISCDKLARFAARIGSIELLSFAFDPTMRGAQCVNRALAAACRGGHDAAMAFIIAIAASRDSLNSLDWSGAFVAACKGGHYAIAVVIMDRGRFIHWSRALIAACARGHLHLAHAIMQNAPSVRDLNWNGAIAAACARGHRPIVNFIRLHIADIDWELALCAACKMRSSECLVIAAEIVALESPNVDWTLCLQNACSGPAENSRIAAYWIAGCGASANLNWSCALEGACESHSRCARELINLAIAHGGRNWNQGLTGAIRGHNYAFATEMIARGAANLNIELYAACIESRADDARFLLDHGASRDILIEFPIQRALLGAI